MNEDAGPYGITGCKKTSLPNFPRHSSLLEMDTCCKQPKLCIVDGDLFATLKHCFSAAATKLCKTKRLVDHDK